jgi:hypothetical protein
MVMVILVIVINNDNGNDDDDDDDNNNNNNINWKEQVPKSVETRQKVTTLWNQRGQTDRTIPNSKPNITIRDKESENVR